MSRSVRQEGLGIVFPRALLPSDGIDYARWSVIACDQYTSNPDYWARVEGIVGDQPSTLRLIFPEVYLGASDADARLEAIGRTTGEYLRAGVLEERPAAPILVERNTGSGRRRIGLLLAFDLEQYDFSPGSTSLIRPTEETITERLPPRMRIRRVAAAEFPHILILVDDRPRSVVEPVFSLRDRLTKLYETELMLGGGTVAGYLVDDEEALARMLDGLTGCLERAREESPHSPLLFAVGDGNHSLATAKQIWEERKKEGAGPDDPARYAMAELINLYDEGLVFEPIHRIVTGRPKGRLLSELVDRTGGRLVRGDDGNDTHSESTLRWILPRESGRLELPTGTGLAGEAVQRALEGMATADRGLSIDYIHGDEALDLLVHENQGLGLLFPALSKAELFSLVATRGALPRKMFSLGEAKEKRYYVEGRSIRP